MRTTIPAALAPFTLALTLAMAAPALAQDDLAKEIDGLRDASPAWRAIEWRSCLLEGLSQARAEGKPALLWVFIDRPADDARC